MNASKETITYPTLSGGEIVMSLHPPVACDFKVGDNVVYTNDYGVTFEQAVIGFRDTDGVKEAYLPGDYIYLNTDCWWMPVSPQNLSKA